MKRKVKRAKLHDVDRLMLDLASSLVRDFQSNLGDPDFCNDYLSVLQRGDVRAIRDYNFAIDLESEDVPRVKALIQIRDLFKRHRFQTDTYSDPELEEMAVAKFLGVQDRLAKLDFNSFPEFIERVLDRAAGYIAKVLGEYSDEECRDLSKHGRRATVGVPARKACEAERWEIPITGSQQQIDWFDSEMSQNCMVQEYIARQSESDPLRSIYQPTSCLTLTLVPKTFKSLRVIMPNTTIGSYQSLGIGEMVRKRLKRAGYDIRKLQAKHRILAKKASQTGRFVTADLSSASDSITDELVRRIFPKDWYEVLSTNRIRCVRLPGDIVIESKTFCTMGIGYTFPLQTLVFLSLLKAIERIYYRARPNLISVYGDDMIYHSSLHKYVMVIFSWLGFEINVEKTYSKGHFRESCGGDYFRGVDVRPFQPRNGQVHVGDHAYEAMLYKWTNGLLARWSEHEVTRALSFLTSRLMDVVEGAKLVPIDYPDDSGIKCPTLTSFDFLKNVRCVKPKHVGHGIFRFIYLRFKPKLKEEKRHEPYYWAALRNVISSDYYADTETFQAAQQSNLYNRINDCTGVGRCRLPAFVLRKQGPAFRSKLTGKRLISTRTCRVIPTTGSYVRQTGTSCFEDRRRPSL